MVIPKREQSRIWCIAIIYKHRKKNIELTPIKQAESVNDLIAIFGDDIIFEYTKGDLEYFLQLYQAIVRHYADLRREVGKLGFLSETMFAAALCFAAEIRYLRIDRPLLLSIYSKILAQYGENDHAKVLSKVGAEEVLSSPSASDYPKAS